MGNLNGKIARRSQSSCPGPNNLPPLQFHSVHGDNVRISRDGRLARRFESFCRAITFSSRPVRINERICVKIVDVSNNWNGGIRFGFTNNDPCSLESALPKFACPDLTTRPGFWAKALHEQYCDKDNILFYYVNSDGEVIYGINNEDKGVILTGIDIRGLLWTIIDVYGNCTAIEFLDSRIFTSTSAGTGTGTGPLAHTNGIQLLNSSNNGSTSTLPVAQMPLSAHHPHQHSRHSLPVCAGSGGGGGVGGSVGAIERDIDRMLMPSMQSLNISAAEQTALEHDIANGLPRLRYNANGRLIPVPLHITKGRNLRLSHDRFVASRVETEFCQGYVFTARPIRIGEKLIVQILKTESMYAGSLALGLTSCNPASLPAAELPNDSDFLLDRPEYWVLSKDVVATPQRGDEIAFFVAPNGEVSISKNNGPAVVVMHVDQTLQLWAFLDVYGSTQSVRIFRQQLPNMVAYPAQPQICAGSSSSSRLLLSGESLNGLNSQIQETARKSLNSVHSAAVCAASTTTISSCQSSLSSSSPRMISVPSNGDILQIQPNSGGTVLVVNLPPATSSHDLAAGANQVSRVSAACVSSSTNNITTSCSSNQFIDANNANANVNVNNKWRDQPDGPGARAECTICYENAIDSVLYMCGHMCMCYECAIEQWRGAGGGQCPLCRAIIRDVIRTYTT